MAQIRVARLDYLIFVWFTAIQQCSYWIYVSQGTDHILRSLPTVRASDSKRKARFPDFWNPTLTIIDKTKVGSVSGRYSHCILARNGGRHLTNHLHQSTSTHSARDWYVIRPANPAPIHCFYQCLVSFLCIDQRSATTPGMKSEYSSFVFLLHVSRWSRNGHYFLNTELYWRKYVFHHGCWKLHLDIEDY